MLKTFLGKLSDTVGQIVGQSLSVVFGAVFMSESGALTLFSCLPWFTVHRFREIFIQ